MSARPRPRRILPAIVASQFAGTSLWFAVNAVLPEMQRAAGWPGDAVGAVTSAVQLGFIAGTLTFALLAVADRWPARRVFFACALGGAAVNLAALAATDSLPALLALRFATGFLLAGVYPVGMRIAAGWWREGLGTALGWLVGALVLGTALPWGLRALGAALPWQAVIAAVSAISAAGGALLVWLVPDEPGTAARSPVPFEPRALLAAFAAPRFRASACGYFGHMWELYAFYAFVPVLLAARLAGPAAGGSGVDGGAGAAGLAATGNMVDGRTLAAWAFAVIAMGSVGCVAGGLASRRIGSARVAGAQLAASGACCVASPLMFLAPLPVFLAYLLFWGAVVAGDSPQFSALNAAYAPPGRVGSALTIANCIGFAITIVSIQLLAAASAALGPRWLMWPLAPGPMLGLLALRPLLGRAPTAAATS